MTALQTVMNCKIRAARPVVRNYAGIYLEVQRTITKPQSK
jgi:hypothetical protein